MSHLAADGLFLQPEKYNHENFTACCYLSLVIYNKVCVRISQKPFKIQVSHEASYHFHSNKWTVF